MADRWAPPKADEHLKKPVREDGRAVIVVPPSPVDLNPGIRCGYTAALNVRLLRAVMALGGLPREDLDRALTERRSIVRELRAAFGDKPDPDKLAQVEEMYMNRLARAARISPRLLYARGVATHVAPQTRSAPTRDPRQPRDESEVGDGPGGVRSGDDGGPEAGARPQGGRDPGPDAGGGPGSAGGAGSPQEDAWWAGLEELECGGGDEP